jgi:DNA repair exonuclease SbcCD ATPase subunit
MNPAAHVTSIEGMADFRAALLTFTEKAKDSLSTVDLELRRMIDWLADQAKQWQAEIRTAENAVFEAKNELARKKMMRIGDRRPDTTDQEKALRRAQARLEHAEEKLGRTRHWQRAFPDAMLDYQGPARQLQFLLDAQVPQMNAYLNQKIEALEKYQQMSG